MCRVLTSIADIPAVDLSHVVQVSSGCGHDGGGGGGAVMVRDALLSMQFHMLPFHRFNRTLHHTLQ